MDDFWAWLNLGVESGWCSAPMCQTHEGLPLTDEEEEAAWDGGEPCMAAVRLYEPS